MKIAVCYSGIPKFFDKSHEYVNNNLFLNFEKVDVFFHCWQNNVLQTEKKKIIDLYNPKKYIFEDEKTHILNYPFKQSKSLPNNVFSMFYSIMKSNKLKKEYEQKNNFKYDWVFRMRFDYALNRKIDATCLAELDNSFVYVNNFQDYDNLHCADCFAFSNSNNMNIYSNTYNNILSFGKNNVILAGEAMLYHQLLQNKIKLKIFDVNHAFKPDYLTCWCNHSLIRN